MTPTSPSTPTTRTPLWLRLVLILSLALNLLVAGTVIGHMMRDDPRGRVPRIDRIEGPMTFALTKDDRREIGKALRQKYRENRPSRQQIVEDYQGVIAALRSEPFQPAQVEQAFRNQRAAAVTRMEIGQELLIERLSAMTPEERHDFADRLEEGLKRGPGHAAKDRDGRFGDGKPRDGWRGDR